MTESFLQLWSMCTSALDPRTLSDNLCTWYTFLPILLWLCTSSFRMVFSVAQSTKTQTIKSKEIDILLIIHEHQEHEKQTFYESFQPFHMKTSILLSCSKCMFALQQISHLLSWQMKKDALHIILFNENYLYQICLRWMESCIEFSHDR